MPSREVRIVIPTLGQRIPYLRSTMQSISSQSLAPEVVVVAPSLTGSVASICDEFNAIYIPDPGRGLSAAINAGVDHSSADFDYINWLGDDDLLLPNSLARTKGALARHPEAVVAFGRCQYINPEGEAIGTSRAGRLAPWLMTWGPDLVPQPGMLVRADAWRQLGGLDESLKYAMDLDLLLRLRRVGPFVSLAHELACFRWHPDSLTVAGRSESVAEAERVKRRYYGSLARRSSRLWEPFVKRASLWAGQRVSARAVTSTDRTP